MAGWTCAECTTTYTVGAPKCPNCGSTERAERSGGSVLPSVTVVCGNAACQYEGRERRVHLRTAAPGVVEVPRLACAGCGLEMPTVTPWPPVTESEENMPKITVHGGPSIADTGVAVVGEHGVELDPATAGPAEEEEGGEDVSAGNSSPTSSEREQNSPEQSEQQSQSPAPTTASRSKRGRTGSRSADSTDGDQAADTSAADDK